MSYLTSYSVILDHCDKEYHLSTWFNFRTLEFVVSTNIQMGRFYHPNIKKLEFLNTKTNEYVSLTSKLSEIAKGNDYVIKLKTLSKIGTETKACR